MWTESAVEDPIVNFLTQCVGVIFRYTTFQFKCTMLVMSPAMELTQTIGWVWIWSSLDGILGLFWKIRVSGGFDLLEASVYCYRLHSINSPLCLNIELSFPLRLHLFWPRGNLFWPLLNFMELPDVVTHFLFSGLLFRWPRETFICAHADAMHDYIAEFGP